MGLALWVLPGVTYAPGCEGHKNWRNSNQVPISPVNEQREAVSSGEVCYVFSATEATGLGAIYTCGVRHTCCCWLHIAAS